LPAPDNAVVIVPHWSDTDTQGDIQNGTRGKADSCARRGSGSPIAAQELIKMLHPRVRQHDQWSELQKRYAYWLLQEPQRLAQLMARQAPIPSHFEIGSAPRKTVQNYLRRVIRRRRGEWPRVKLARSMTLDAEMYHVFEQDGVQYIKVMSLTPRHVWSSR
jgi:hypothetical protein